MIPVVPLTVVRRGADDAHRPAVAALDDQVRAHDRRPAVQNPEVLDECVEIQVGGYLLDLQPGGGAVALPWLQLGRVGRVQLEGERVVGDGEPAAAGPAILSGSISSLSATPATTSQSTADQLSA